MKYISGPHKTTYTSKTMIMEPSGNFTKHLTLLFSNYQFHRYNSQKDNSQNINTQAKKSYAEKRDYLWNLPNKRPVKLKEKLKELEVPPSTICSKHEWTLMFFQEQVQNNRIVYCKWTDNCVLRIIINTGLIINVCVNIYTGDIQKISFDKFLVGKLLSEYITDGNFIFFYTTILTMGTPHIVHSVWSANF